MVELRVKGGIADIFLNRPEKSNALNTALLEELLSVLKEIAASPGLRDSQTIEKLAWPAYCGARSAPLNLVRHHAVDAQVAIGCGGVPVYPGDVVVGDQEGVVVIPANIANEVAEEGAAQTLFEDWVEAKVKEGRSIFGLYPPSAETRAEFEAWKKKK